MQRRFYFERGLSSWSDFNKSKINNNDGKEEELSSEIKKEKTVPYFITSNPLISIQYASIIFSFILEQKKDNSNLPIYIIELGTGHGKFSKLVVHDLHRIMLENGMERKDCEKEEEEEIVVFVMTDFSREIVDEFDGMIENDEIMKLYCDSSMLDLSNEELEITLDRRGTKISQMHVTSAPMAFIANYMFDTIPTDVFRVSEEGDVFKGLVTSFSTNSQFDHDPSSPHHIHCLKRMWNYEKSQSPHIPSLPICDEILENEYSENLTSDSTFCVPTRSCQILDQLTNFSSSSSLWLVGDKGHVSIESLKNQSGF